MIQQSQNRIIQPGPFIRPARIKWQRDPGITDLIEYFDEERFLSKKTDRERFAILTAKESEYIARVIEKCRASFPFCSRNFFWIAEKGRGDRLLQLWESQELIYEHIQRLKDAGLPQKLFIIKARQLGCSTLIEAMIAWRTMFFRNVNAIVVSYNPKHAGELFGIMQHIYDQMPWWLKPMCSSREYMDGLVFDNPDYDDRRQNPGLKSKVKAEGSNKRTGVGQGLSISAAHISEMSDYRQEDAREIIEEDLGNALVDSVETFAIIETTAKGSANYTYDFWNKCVELEEQGQADWHPVFLPWFFESTRVWPVEPGWKPEQSEVEMKERISMDWLRCDNADCHQYHERFHRTLDRNGSTCITCNNGTLYIYGLTDSQLRWMQRRRKNAEKDSDSKKKLLQEQASTAESAFQTSGYQIFGEGAQDFVNNSIKPPIKVGFLDKAGKVHGPDPNKVKINPSNGSTYEACYVDGCDQDHQFGDDNGEKPLRVWKEPEPDGVYAIGGDPAEGLGQSADYSVGAVLKINRPGIPDEVVAVFRSNNIEPIAFAIALNFLGRTYNSALMAVEMNRYDTTMNWLRFQLAYPNMYFRSANQCGWHTQMKTKAQLYHTMKRWIQMKLIDLPSRNFAKEMKTFTKDDYDGTAASAEGSAKDDECLATMIALFCAHENDWDENLGQMSVRRELTMAEAEWHFSCNACSYRWPTKDTDQKRCPRCNSMMIQGTINRDAKTSQSQENPFMNGDIAENEAQEYAERFPMAQSEEPEHPSYDEL